MTSTLRSSAERRLSIHTSNRLEVLVERFAREVADDPPPPLEREIVVVQSLGMSRWLTLELARRNGLSASLSTPFPAPFARWLAARLLDDGTLDDRTLDDAAPPASEEIPRRDDSLWSRPLLVWRLMRHLATAGDDPGLEAAASALRPTPDLESLDSVDLAQRRLYELAHRLAGLYDGYQLFRPRMLREWLGQGSTLDPERPLPPRDRETAAWQAHLWRRLVSETIDGRPIEPPFSERLLDLVARLESADVVPTDRLPRRLTVFGATSLPPAFIDLLAALSRFVPVSIDFVSPTHHYWADVRSEREQERLRRRLLSRRLQRGGDARWVESQHVEAGNPLLAALGRQGRELFDLLQRADADGSAWQELEFVDPEGSTALEVLQSDILHLVDRGAATGDAARLPLPPDLRPTAPDGLRSLEVHVCHSPGREMEVLRDRLLATFAADPTLRPSDVLVLVPDVELYGPFVQAVFGTARDGARSRESDVTLPFSIADRGAGRERPPAETLLDLLDLVGARMAQRDVFDLLDVPAVRRAAGLAHGDLPRLRRLTEAARVRWGVDGAQKHRDFDVPAAEQNTWRAGLDRLILGYATGSIDGLDGSVDPDGEPIAGAVRGVDRTVVPLAGDTAGDAESLGRFALFLDALFAHLERLRAPRPLADWSRDLVAAIDALLAPEGEAEEMGVQLARDACAELAEAAERIGWAVLSADDDSADDDTSSDESLRDTWTDVALPAVREHLEARLRGETFGSGFLDGRITFAKLEPMRSIPFRVVALCGLDDGVFPRRDPESGLDLVRRAPRPGDRSLREDDRHLFLEMLLAARDKLLLSHVGRSQLDGAERAPSPVLAELLDHLDRTFEPAPGERAARDAVVAVHRLQPWSAAAFDRERPLLWSASTDALAAARTAERTRVRVADGMDDDAEVAASRFAVPAGPALGLALSPRSKPAEDDGGDDGGDEDDDTVEIVAIDELIRFWIDPSRAFCRALGLRLPDGPNAVDEAEPFTVGGLDGWRIRQDMLERRLARDESLGESSEGDARTADLRAERELLQARGLLPPGALGAALHRELDARVEAFRARLPPHRREPPRRLAIEATTGALRWRLSGRARHLTDRGPLIVRCGPLRPRDTLRAWITHLALAAEGSPTTPTLDTRVVAETGTLRLPPAPIDKARALLGVLIDGRRAGLEHPLPVFERASHAFVEAHLRGVDPSRAGARRSPKDVARDVFHGRDRPTGDAPPAEADDAAVRQAFRREAGPDGDTTSTDPLDLPAFEAWSRRLWEPLLRIAR